MRETQETIRTWGLATFGEARNNLLLAARANDEMAELLSELARDDNSPKAASEIADVVICLYRLAARMGVDVACAVDDKMAINRQRQWVTSGDGVGKHKKG